MKSRLSVLAACAVLMVWAGIARAHDVGQSYLFFTIGTDTVDVRVEFGVPDLITVLGLDIEPTERVSREDLAPYDAAIVALALERLRLAPGGVDQAPEVGAVGLFNTTKTQLAQVDLRLGGLPGRPQYIDVTYDALFDEIPSHAAFAVVENNWAADTFENESNIALTFSSEQRTARLDLSQSSVLTGFFGMVKLGVEHIWGGIDHVLFLLALLLPSVMRREHGRWEPVPDLRTALVQVVKVVTVFTVAHTITLSAATLDVVVLPARLVESVIAISIAIVALDIIVPMFRNWTYTVVLGFGLFHGFGFASILKEMPIPPSYMALSLVGFNLGVEIGQVVIVACAVPLLFMLRRYRFYARPSMPAGAALLILISMYWFVERAFAVDLPAGAVLNRIIGWVS